MLYTMLATAAKVELLLHVLTFQDMRTTFTDIFWQFDKLVCWTISRKAHWYWCLFSKMTIWYKKNVSPEKSYRTCLVFISILNTFYKAFNSDSMWATAAVWIHVDATDWSYIPPFFRVSFFFVFFIFSSLNAADWTRLPPRVSHVCCSLVRQLELVEAG